jgi:hypothetical protein
MASIRCGHCKATHTSVAQVAECANQEAEAKWEYEMERAAERFWEEGTEAQAMRYRDEVEQDERRAFAMAGIFPGSIL